MKSKIVKKSFKSFLLFNLFILLVGISHAIFLIPNKVVSGGFMSISMVLYHLMNLSGDEGILVPIIYVIINCPLLLLSYKIFGMEFILKSLYSTLVLPFFTILISSLFLLLPIDIPEMSIWTAAILAGITSGIGICGANLMSGSSGGVDILAKIMNHWYGKLSIGSAVTLNKILIVLSSSLVFPVENVIASIVSAISTGIVVDLTGKILRGKIDC